MLFLVHCGMAPLCIADDNAILFVVIVTLLFYLNNMRVEDSYVCIVTCCLSANSERKGCIVMYAVWVNSCTV